MGRDSLELEEYLSSLTGRYLRKSDHARVTFAELSDEIATGWQARKKRDGRKRVDGESANEWFKRHAYLLIKRYIAAGQTDIFEALVRHHRRHPAGRSLIEDSPFRMGLLAMFPTANGLTRSERRLFGLQMEYAWRHKITSRKLNGFVSRIGPAGEIERKLEQEQREPGYLESHMRW